MRRHVRPMSSSLPVSHPLLPLAPSAFVALLCARTWSLLRSCTCRLDVHDVTGCWRAVLVEGLGACNPPPVGSRQHREILVVYGTGITVVKTSRASSPATCLNNAILDMAFGFQDSLGIYGASWQYLIVNLSSFWGPSGTRYPRIWHAISLNPQPDPGQPEYCMSVCQSASPIRLSDRQTLP